MEVEPAVSYTIPGDVKNLKYWIAMRHYTRYKASPTTSLPSSRKYEIL